MNISFNAIDNIEEYYKEINSCEKLKLNTMVTDAILMQLQYLGESMNKANKYYKKIYNNDIPYEFLKEIVGTRNWISHDYLGVSVKVLCKIINEGLPDLKIFIQELSKNI